jgi:hypothetical protein
MNSVADASLRDAAATTCTWAGSHLPKPMQTGPLIPMPFSPLTPSRLASRLGRRSAYRLPRPLTVSCRTMHSSPTGNRQAVEDDDPALIGDDWSSDPLPRLQRASQNHHTVYAITLSTPAPVIAPRFVHISVHNDATMAPVFSRADNGLR